MEELRRCISCDYETTEPLKKCPQCGRQLRTARQNRKLGWVLVGVGGFLVAFMGWIAVDAVRTRSNDDPMLMYGVVFSIAEAIGLVGIIGGILQICSGRPNKKIRYLGIVLVFALIVALTVLNNLFP